MRILIKGGVWKNSEDEILKAAVMKYGKNQWARVASLLNRKSSKQCKARWYEWLDPSVKKIEWNREEEEKLLHLAKIMPNQWRTIAPIVGRTTAQCIEHYERLLDEANEEEGGGMDRTDDPRRLRPGEIDPTPETKPARPDPIDMDSDEIEMLSEARARLANTQGKKEKRKAREQQLDESRRMAMLQKRRELKAAGIESKLGSAKRKRHIDYANEIPFQKAVPLGFYDVTEENNIQNSIKVDPTAHAIEVQKLENRREVEDEERKRNLDKKRLKTMLRDNAPAVVSMIAEQNDPTSLRVRSALRLPEPQVSDGELEDVVRTSQLLHMAPPIGFPQRNLLEGGFGSSSSSSSSSSGGGRGGGSSGAIAGQTPLRTPMREDIILIEARNQKAMRSIPSVLNSTTSEDGEESNSYVPDLRDGTGFSGASPRAHVSQTPNTLLARNSNGNSNSSRYSGSDLSSVRSSATASSMALRTPLRDQLGLNDSSAMMGDMESFSDLGSVSGSSIRSHSSYLRNQQNQWKSNLASQLKSLPEPEFSIELSIPNIDQSDENERSGAGGTADYFEDASEKALRLAREKVAADELEYSKHSSVMKKGLPRPAGRLTTAQVNSIISRDCNINDSSNNSSSNGGRGSFINEVIVKEMCDLMEYDEYKYPVVSSGRETDGPEALPVELESFSEVELRKAKRLVDEEVSSSFLSDGSSMCLEEVYVNQFKERWFSLQKEVMFIPNRSSEGCFDVPSSKGELLSSMATNYQALKARIDKNNKKISKLDSKLNLLTKGYVNRSAKLQENIFQSSASLRTLSNDLASAEAIFAMERRAAPLRLQASRMEMTRAVDGERALQEQYAQLVKLIKMK